MDNEKLHEVIKAVQAKQRGISPYAIDDFIYADWPDRLAHLNWLEQAPVAEIASWVLASGFWEVA